VLPPVGVDAVLCTTGFGFAFAISSAVCPPGLVLEVLQPTSTTESKTSGKMSLLMKRR